MAAIRSLRLPQDAEGVVKLDTSFDTDRIYNAEVRGNSFHLVETSANFYKRYNVDMDDLARLSALHYAVVAIDGDEVVGLAAAEYMEWNRRVILHHLYVSRDLRGAGIGKSLLNSVLDWSQLSPARCLWLETQNVNYPAIQFYTQAGFSLCGFDLTLYSDQVTDAPEIGLFYSMLLG